MYTVSSGNCPSFSCSSLLMLTAGPRGQFPRWLRSRKRLSVCSVLRCPDLWLQCSVSFVHGLENTHHAWYRSTWRKIYPHIPHRVTWDWTRESANGGRGLAAWAMTRQGGDRDDYIITGVAISKFGLIEVILDVVEKEREREREKERRGAQSAVNTSQQSC